MIEHATAFNEDYFEHGLAKGISLYENYHWMPERSFREAHWFTRHFRVEPEDTIIDFGCAKGYFVKALRCLGYEAFGLDTSDYALAHADEWIKPFLFKSTKQRFTVGLCKDVLEHCPTEEILGQTLELMFSLARTWLLIVPIAKAGKYINPHYEKDITHHLRLTIAQWMGWLRDTHGEVMEAQTKMLGFKEKWAGYQGDLFLTVDSAIPQPNHTNYAAEMETHPASTV